MSPRLSSLVTGMAVTLLTVTLVASPAQAQFGTVFTGTGPVHGGMGSVSVANPIDAPGPLYWNTAAISGLEQSEISFALSVVWPRSTLASSIDAGAFGFGIPPGPLSGSTGSDLGPVPIPLGALVYKPEASPWSFGLGFFPVAGFGVNYPASNTNPILTPQPPHGIGLGAVFSELQVLEVSPGISYQLTDRLSIGFAPALNLAIARLDPLLVAAPDNANGDGFPTYPPGTHTRFNWGGGAQAGVYWAHETGWRLGASLKSPRWFEKGVFQSTDELGRPRTITLAASLPLIASAGVGYAGLDRWLFALDTHYIDYNNAETFRQTGFDPSGAVRGLGWHSIWAVAVGAQYRVTEALALRMGYSWNQNPIDNQLSSFNVASPAIVQNQLSVGASYRLTDCIMLSFAYAHGFQNSISGPITASFGTIPGSAVTSTTSGDIVGMAATVFFGGAPSRRSAPPSPPEDGG